MKKEYLLAGGIAVVISIVLIYMVISGTQKSRPEELQKSGLSTQQTTQPITTTAMQLSSPAFNDGDNIPSLYTCDGRDISPPLSFKDIPSNAKSLALIVDDPDAPVGDWVHWLVWNIKPDIKEIAENSVPDDSIQGMTDFGKPGWGGPCPPSGVHHYQFKLYALDDMLDLPVGTKKTGLEKAMGPHTLAKSTLVGLYHRK